MSDIGYDAVFNGVDGPNVAHLLRIARVNALQQDRSKDDEWIAQWTAAHLDGPALFWYEGLSEEIQDSWKLLRRELLIRWAPLEPAPVISPVATAPIPVQSPKSNHSGRVTVPTPAAAPPSAAAPINRLPDNKRRGRIRLIALDGEALGYVSRIPDKDNDYCIGQLEADALIVSFTLSNHPHELRISDTELLGITFGFQFIPENAKKQGRMSVGDGVDVSQKLTLSLL